MILILQSQVLEARIFPYLTPLDKSSTILKNCYTFELDRKRGSTICCGTSSGSIKFFKYIEEKKEFTEDT